MFIGEYRHTVDEKSRLAIPAKFRAVFKKGAVISLPFGSEKCLFLFTKDEWAKLAQKIASAPSSQSNTRAFARRMFSGAMDVTFDKQGRIVLPDYLVKNAGLARDVVIAGLYNRLEIWDKNSWISFKENASRQSEEIAEKMGELGI